MRRPLPAAEEKKINDHKRGPALSLRLRRIAEQVSAGAALADIGTDHALIPVRLALDGRISRAYACDIGSGPLERAKAQVERFGLQSRIETRIGDGLEGLNPGEADSILIAGMGGEMIAGILRRAEGRRDESGRGFRESVQEWIFSPHTEARALRRYLRRNGYRLRSELLVEDGGKRYPILKAEAGDGELAYRESRDAGFPDALSEEYGPLLLLRADEVLRRHMAEELQKKLSIARRLKEAAGSGSPAALVRLGELDEEIAALKRCVR